MALSGEVAFPFTAENASDTTKAKTVSDPIELKPL
jgi:hypothetical protein